MSDQSPGAKIGHKSAAVVNITNGKLLYKSVVFSHVHICKVYAVTYCI